MLNGILHVSVSIKLVELKFKKKIFLHFILEVKCSHAVICELTYVSTVGMIKFDK